MDRRMDGTLKGGFVMKKLLESDYFCLVPWALTALLCLGGWIFTP